MQKVVRGLGDDIVEELECDSAFGLGVDGDVKEDARVGHDVDECCSEGGR